MLALDVPGTTRDSSGQFRDFDDYARVVLDILGSRLLPGAPGQRVKLPRLEQR